MANLLCAILFQHCLLMGELSVLITLLATLQKWWFKSSGEIPLVVLVFAGGCLLVSRLIARHLSFEFLLCAKVSEKEERKN